MMIKRAQVVLAANIPKCAQSAAKRHEDSDDEEANQP